MCNKKAQSVKNKCFYSDNIEMMRLAHGVAFAYSWWVHPFLFESFERVSPVIFKYN